MPDNIFVLRYGVQLLQTFVLLESIKMYLHANIRLHLWYFDTEHLSL